VASISATDAWAVGEQNLDQTLIELSQRRYGADLTYS
jgi:hypothetical protein